MDTKTGERLANRLLNDGMFMLGDMRRLAEEYKELLNCYHNRVQDSKRLRSQIKQLVNELNEHRFGKGIRITAIQGLQEEIRQVQLRLRCNQSIQIDQENQIKRLEKEKEKLQSRLDARIIETRQVQRTNQRVAELRAARIDQLQRQIVVKDVRIKHLRRNISKIHQLEAQIAKDSDELQKVMSERIENYPDDILKKILESTLAECEKRGILDLRIPKVWQEHYRQRLQLLKDNIAQRKRYDQLQKQLQSQQKQLEALFLKDTKRAARIAKLEKDKKELHKELQAKIRAVELIRPFSNQYFVQQKQLEALSFESAERVIKITKLEEDKKELTERLFESCRQALSRNTLVRQYKKAQVAAKSKLRVKELLKKIIPLNELYGYEEQVQWIPKLSRWGVREYIDRIGKFRNLYSTNVKEILRNWDGGRDYYWVPSKCQGGNSYGSTVNRANYLAIVREYTKIKGVYYLEGDDGAYGIAISLRWLVEGSPEALELLEKLTPFGIINQDVLDRLEAELINKAWTESVGDQFIKAIEEKFEVNLEINDYRKFRELFDEAVKMADEKWTFDASRKAKIDINAVVGWIKIVDCCVQLCR